MDMNLISCEYTLDKSKVIFSYVADERVDFRELLKVLASKLHTRIELRQIGSRDEVRLLGGIGPCGKVCCCVQNLGELEHVSMKMAKNQNLSLNPASISGLCGKLLCCLAYENPTYQEALQLMPRVNSTVSTKDGNGTVVFNDLLKREVDVKFVRGDDTEIKTYPLEEIKFKRDDK